MGFPARKLWSQVSEQVADVAGLVATPLSPTHYLELVRPLASTRTHYARVESIRYETMDTRTLTLRTGRGWVKHRAGQYVTVGVPVKGRITTRTYSVSSAPERDDGCITITVKLVPNGKASSALFREVKPGDHLAIGLAKGDFTVPETPVEPQLFVTGGSGITPVMSMLRSFAIRNEMPDVVHVHYAPTERDIIFADELTRIAADHPSYRPIFLTTREGRSGKSHRFDRASLHREVPDWSNRETYACGPATLLEAIEACFTEQNATDQLHVERFRPKLAKVDPNAQGGFVRFGLSKKTVEANAQTSLLEAAERVGVVAPHGCRIGICHSCDVIMKTGCVRDMRTGEMISEAGARVQLCVCAAAGDVEVNV
ncbi:MAG: ferredoxin reductase [Polyangiaceae bacterium]